MMKQVSALLAIMDIELVPMKLNGGAGYPILQRAICADLACPQHVR
jgi:hypothetical protein